MKKKKKLILFGSMSLGRGISSTFAGLNVTPPLTLITAQDLQDFCIVAEGDTIRGYNDLILDGEKSYVIQNICQDILGDSTEDQNFKLPLKENYYQSLGIAQYVRDTQGIMKDACKEKNIRYECDFTSVAEKIYSATMSDYFKLKRAGIAIPTTGENKEQISDMLNIARGENTKKTYEDYQKFYPKTVQMMKKNNKEFQKMVDHLQIIDYTKLSESEKGQWIENRNSTTFLETLYNEYYRYNLFLLFYKHMLSQRKTMEAQIQMEMVDELVMNSYIILQKTLADLKNFASTYQVHLFLVAYQESLLDLRDNYLAKMITPFYTFYEKFRNVQPL